MRPPSKFWRAAKLQVSGLKSAVIASHLLKIIALLLIKLRASLYLGVLHVKKNSNNHARQPSIMKRRMEISRIKARAHTRSLFYLNRVTESVRRGKVFSVAPADDIIEEKKIN